MGKHKKNEGFKHLEQGKMLFIPHELIGKVESLLMDYQKQKLRTSEGFILKLSDLFELVQKGEANKSQEWILSAFIWTFGFEKFKKDSHSWVVATAHFFEKIEGEEGNALFFLGGNGISKQIVKHRVIESFDNIFFFKQSKNPKLEVD